MILEAIIFMVSLGIFIGIIIAYASQKFVVEKSELAKEILAVLPGINCGACGYAGCEAYAKAVESGEATPDKCIPGKKEVTEKIKELLENNKK